ncbi:MAG: DUF4160 domain-containing protein [Spirochaetales bacterium]|nr:DUF4160 domain-containing protein [Spirochaetales bacterium]
MPELSRFYGIVIRLYLEEKEHNPPHIHAKYGSNAATINIENGEVLSGNLPVNAKSLVKKWVLLHSKEIKEIWETQEFRKIKPLE